MRTNLTPVNTTGRVRADDQSRRSIGRLRFAASATAS
jgi:hypothetical protein